MEYIMISPNIYQKVCPLLFLFIKIIEQEWKIRNIVLDNVAYPCVYEEDDEFHEVYSDAMDALYDDMKRKVNEFCRTRI